MGSLRPGFAAHGLGLIPSPIDFSYLKSARMGLGASSYPASFDLRTLGKLSPIENQGSYGCCWAFASMGSLESCLLPSDQESFSEDNLVLNSGFDYDPYNGGGTFLMATAYLARWAGPVAASQDAYGDGHTPPGLVADKHVQQALYLPPRTNSLDNDAIKSAIMNHGAVYTSLYADSGMQNSTTSPAYNASSAAYYYSGSTTPDHAVDIVGWNDAYSASNFSTAPPGNGAFIVRNSWGAGWGNAGYFYVSYYDASLGYQTNAVFDDAEPTSNFGAIYQYDPLGWTDSFGYSSDSAWFANGFTASASDQLSAVSFYAAEPGSTYTVYASAGSSTTMTAEGSGSLDVAGYHTVALTSPMQLTSGQNFVVAVCLTTPGYDYPIPLETNITGYSSGATSAPGESFVSSNGNTWTDLTTISGEQDSNVCLKAFTRYTAPADLTPPTTRVSGADARWHKSAVTLAFTATDNAGGSGVKYTDYSVDGGSWTVGTSITIPAPANHSNDRAHTIRYSSTDNAGNVEATKSCQVKIDTLGPVCSARSVSVKRNHTCTLWFNVADKLSPTVTQSLVITKKSGSVKRHWSWGYDKVLAKGYWWTIRYRCTLARGTYYIRVYGKDLAGNIQSVVGKAYLHVK